EASRLVNGREFTADDVVFRLNQVLTSDTTENGSELGIGLWFISATATDKYTVVVKGMPDGAAGIGYAFLRISDVTNMHPPEVIEKYGEMNDWRNVVGTGPFIITESIDGVSVTAKRNPNYWQKDPLFPENQLPYLDGIKRLFISDPSTRFAALRTGQVDYVQDIEKKDAENLLNGNPELEYKKELFNDPYIALTMNVQHKPFDDIRVRRAMSMAIDRPTILRDYYGGDADLLSWPVVNIPDFSGAYVPLEELPASTRELYEYHPDKAKQLLTEAGFADGFTFTAVMDAPNVEIAQIYKSDLAKVGITMNIDVRERPVFRSIMGNFQHEAAFWCPGIREIYEGTYLTPESSSNYAQIFDPVIVDYKKKLTAFENQGNKALLDQLATELNLYLRSQAYFIVPPLPYVYVIWQPWLKNYYGLPSVGPSNYWAADLRAWIDEDVKK
ncbi:MAG: ABC transporter substrate-binding protein, partial [Dehalococcoidales bacterium]|nr:ABC transporter substrate-binding protein [Dehalococcoidales bacterium]